MKDKKPEIARGYIRAMEHRKTASSPYSVKPDERGSAVPSSIDVVDTQVIGMVSLTSGPPEAAEKLTRYVEASRELTADVLSQHKVGGSEFVRTFLMGRFSKKLGLEKALELTKPEIIREMMIRLLASQAKTAKKEGKD